MIGAGGEWTGDELAVSLLYKVVHSALVVRSAFNSNTESLLGRQQCRYVLRLSLHQTRPQHFERRRNKLSMMSYRSELQ